MTSKPSGTPSPPSGQRSSTTSWRTPEPGDVLSYAYLWADEAERGQEEGRKDRPVVVVVAVVVAGNRTQLLVAPITHLRPDTGEGVEIPPAVKRQLGLDDERSWVVITEVNRFIWPGPDVRLAPKMSDPFFGVVPAKLYEKVRVGILANNERFRATKRTD